MKKKLIAQFFAGLLVFSAIPFLSREVEAGSAQNVSGYAWSENIGWISFNCTDRDTCGTSDYGVNINPSDGLFSGYAWSENIGWISFNAGELSGCPNAPCEARFDLNTRNISGWAKALAATGGWDGWIRLRDTSYGLWLNDSVSPSEFRDWAWADGVMGWTSFNCANQAVCPLSNYKVVTSLDLNRPPEAVNLSVDAHNSTDYCGVSAYPPVRARWQFSDPDAGDSQSAYRVEIYQGPNLKDRSCDINLNDPSARCLGSSGSYVSTRLSYNTNYTWQIKVWDSSNTESNWASGPAISTPDIIPPHAYPNPDFTWQPLSPALDENVQFTDQSAAYGGATIVSWNWSFGDAICSPQPSCNQSLDPNPTHSYSNTGSYDIILMVSDTDSFSCSAFHQISIGLPIPQWVEIKPF